MEHGYAEVVQRAPGRYDVLDGVNGEAKFTAGAAILEPLARRVLGHDAHQLFNGLLMTQPGSGEQLWHADGEHLFVGTHPKAAGERVYAPAAADATVSALPAHCLNVFVPLVELTMENGVTEFCLGTHTHTGISPDVVWQQQAWRDAIGHSSSPVAMTAPVGSAVLFDYRVLHRGLECRSNQHARPVLYYTFARRWFSDNLNFPLRRAPAHTTSASATAVPVAAGAVDPAMVRPAFPALAAADKLGSAEAPIYLDGPGGTQVHSQVISAMGDALAHRMSNIGYDYASSLGCLELVHSARNAGADFFNCASHEVVFGPSMTSLAFDLATALAPSLSAGDVVYLSRSEHDANISPWLRVAQSRGCTVEWVPLKTDSCTLDLDWLERSLSTSTARPALLAIGAAANSTGVMHDVTRAVTLAKAAGTTYTVVDAVVHSRTALALRTLLTALARRTLLITSRREC
jgi:hypothetical protein